MMQMSLYIGNISSRTHRDGLQHVFRRFGRCTVWLKDGYGFVVYDFPPDAEKALRALQGRNICGEPLTLTWSNKQPRPSKRFARADRSYKQLQDQGFSRGGEYVNHNLDSNNMRDYKMGFEQPESTGGRHSSADILDEKTGYHQDPIIDNVEDEHHEHGEDLLDEDCSLVPNLKDDDRWGGQFIDSANENALEFDRYEPYQSYDRKDEDENDRMTYSGHSPSRGSSQERTRWVSAGSGEVNLKHPYHSKLQQTCYSCGGLGHKMRSCPKGKAAQRKFTRFDHRHKNDVGRLDCGQGELKRHGTRSPREQHSSRDGSSRRRVRNDRKSSDVRKHQSLVQSGSFFEEKENDRACRRNHEGKKRGRNGNGSVKTQNAKKTRRSASSPLHSDYIESISQSASRSLKYLRRSISYSRSRSSSRSPSLSSDSRSNSTSFRNRSKSSKSKAKSRLRSNSFSSQSLTACHGKSILSSPNKALSNQQHFVNDSSTAEAEDILVEKVLAVKTTETLENAKLENTILAVNHGNDVSSDEVGDEKEHLMRESNIEMCKESNLLQELTFQGNQQLENDTNSAAGFSPGSMREVKVAQDSDVSMIENIPEETTRKPDSGAPPSSCSGYLTSITSEEMHTVLKHYNLEPPKESEMHLSVEAYFGSARFWPWDIIYYRRLKKGPISVENYARRLAQNEEFGIVDKYVRSSSGWGELEHGNLTGVGG